MWKLLSFFPYHTESARSVSMTYAREDCAHRRMMAGNPRRFRWEHRVIGKTAGYVVEINEEENA